METALQIQHGASQHSPPPSTPYGDRRASERRESTGRVRLADSEREWIAELVDVSEDGVSVWCSETVELDSLISILLPSGRSPQLLSIDATAVYVREIAPGVWRLGLRFERRLTAPELAGAIH